MMVSFVMLLQEVEKDVKTRTKGEMGAAKTLCSPFEQPPLPEACKEMELLGPKLLKLISSLFSPTLRLVKRCWKSARVVEFGGIRFSRVEFIIISRIR
uniref:Uncharacterized protein n=1 Tax=Cucumis sativus TaxID=3659 RepID=A0A0A0KJM1_CUCSA